MKVTKATVRLFEQDQQAHGTATALSNLLFLAATEQLHDIGAKRIRVSYGSRTTTQPRESVPRQQVQRARVN